MKKYNSVYTMAFAIDHDMEDGSDVTHGMLIDRIMPVAGIIVDAVFEGPDNTIENE